MNDIDAGVLAQSVLIFLAKRSLDQADALQVGKLVLSEAGIESLKNTKTFKALVPKADHTYGGSAK